MGVRIIAALGACVLTTVQAQAGTGLPSMTREGPYGDPLRLRPAFLPDMRETGTASTLGGVAFEAGREGGGPDRASPDPKPNGRARTGAGVSVPHDEDDLPAATPGTFKPVPTKLPGVLLKTRTVTHHLTPDVEVALTPRSSVGLFGEVGKVAIEQGSGLLPSVRARDLGAGVSFQYRLGP